jgi:hypothetical protein
VKGALKFAGDSWWCIEGSAKSAGERRVRCSVDAVVGAGRGGVLVPRRGLRDNWRART